MKDFLSVLVIIRENKSIQYKKENKRRLKAVILRTTGKNIALNLF